LAGRHEGQTQRSFYLSVATWTLKRILILAAAVIVGLLVLRNGFPSNASQGITGTATPTTPQTTVSPPPTSPSPTVSRTPQIEGVVIIVGNGTDRDGLGAEVTQTLENQGYTAKDPYTAPNRQRTTIFYAENFLPEAQLMKDQFFPNAVLRPAGPSIPEDVDLQLVVGADFLESP
jgi:LytR cell envelope-related transcriptional attenuator